MTTLKEAVSELLKNRNSDYLHRDDRRMLRDALRADKARATPDHVNDTVDALTQAESFIAGFEGDELQEGIPEMLAGLRAAIQRERARPDLLAVLKLAITDWPQFDAATVPLSPGCIQEELESQEVNGGDLVEWFGNWRRAFVLPAIAKAEGR